MNAVEVLHLIEQQTGLSGLEFDEHGACVVEFDNRFDVILNTDQQQRTLMLTAVLGDIDSQDNNLCEWLLESNTAQLVGGRALFCLHNDEINLAQVFDTEKTDPHHLLEAFAHLLADADQWQQRFQHRSESTEHQPLHHHHHVTRV